MPRYEATTACGTRGSVAVTLDRGTAWQLVICLARPLGASRTATTTRLSLLFWRHQGDSPSEGERCKTTLTVRNTKNRRRNVPSAVAPMSPSETQAPHTITPVPEELFSGSSDNLQTPNAADPSPLTSSAKGIASPARARARRVPRRGRVVATRGRQAPPRRSPPLASAAIRGVV